MLQLPRLFRVQAALLWLLRDVSKLSCRFSPQLSPLSLSPVPPMCSTLSKHVFFSSSLVLGFPDSLQVVSVNRGSCGRNRIVINLSEQKGSEMQYTTGQGQFLHSDVWKTGIFAISLTEILICHHLGLIQCVPSSAQVTCWVHCLIPALSRQREPWEELPPLVHPEGCGAALRQ